MNLTKEEKTVRNILINVASKKQLIYYSDLCKTANLRLDMSIPADRGKIGEILGHISRYEHENGRPLISSVVVSRSMEQGDGFFKLAEELGFGNWKKLKNGKMFEYVNPEKPDVPLNKNDAFQKVQKRHVQEKR